MKDNKTPETVTVEVIADYPDGKYEKGDTFEVYKSSGKAYLLVSEPDGNCNVFDYPEIFREVTPAPPQREETEIPKKREFKYFANHGDEDGNNCYTICFGDPDDLDEVIVGAEDTEEDAIEAVKRLNDILASITPLPTAESRSMEECKDIVARNHGFANLDEVHDRVGHDEEHRLIDEANKMFYSQTKPQSWVSVEERLPEKEYRKQSYRCLVNEAGEYYPIIGNFDYKKNKWYDEEGDLIIVISWQPLPSPPTP